MTRLRVEYRQMQLVPYVAPLCRELYAVRFHPTVRRFMSNSELVPYRTHRDWTRTNLTDSSETRLWLVRSGAYARAIGLTQLKVGAETGAAEIGIMFREPERHRLACATASAITLHLAFAHFHLDWVSSYVIPEADHALVFNVGGGLKVVDTDRPGLICLKMHRDEYFANEINQRVMARISSRLRISELSSYD